MRKRRPPDPEPLAEHRALAEGWLRYNAGKPNEKNPGAWADDRLIDLLFDDPEAAWQVIDLMWRQAPDDRTLADIAAGPVEFLLTQHGDAFIDRVYLLARREPVFRKLLGAVWRNSMSEPVWEKLKSIAGSTF